ncbi:MAG: WYL domain-containing protein [Anaeroplasmataceae bacterium]|nr:WYL domain-containing protein [Anaeroplasmataceae bacterium]MDE6413908.1 WYL domain-containing protein [Anaeroplasmataceae bacterium]
MPSKKESILCILKVLQNYTDKDHYLTQKEIMDYVYQDYGLSLERKSVSRNISTLIEFDYDIVKSSKGYAMIDRLFSETEMYYLADAIYSSHTISKENTKELIDKILSNSSLHLKEKAISLYKNEQVSKSLNKQIFLNIEILSEAIEKKKKVSFNYIGFDDNGKKVYKYQGFRYVLSPYFLVNNLGRYYCLGCYKEEYGPLSPYRIDYIEDIRIEDEDVIPFANFKSKLPSFSIDKYINEHIYLFGGNVISAKLEIKGPESIVYVYDWFYDKAKIVKENDEIFAYVRCNEHALLYWLMQYGEEVKLLEPTSLRKQVLDNAKRIVGNHS